MPFLLMSGHCCIGWIWIVDEHSSLFIAHFWNFEGHLLCSWLVAAYNLMYIYFSLQSTSQCLVFFCFMNFSHVMAQFYNAPVNEYQAKIILKPLSPNRPWKFIYEPIHQDVRILSKKIPVTKFLNLQVNHLT